MVAFQQDLIAAAGSHQAMAELVEAGVGVGAQEGDGQQRDQKKLGEAKFRVSSFKFQVISTNVP